MKYINLLLTLIAVLLGFIFFRLHAVERLLSSAEQKTQAIVDSNTAVIASNQRLESTLSALKQEIVEFKEKLPKR